MSEYDEKTDPRQESPTVLKEWLIAAITTKDAKLLTRALEGINAWLTFDSLPFDPKLIENESRRDIDQFIRSLEHTQGTLGEAYIYLGDGGVSRLVILVRDGKLTVNTGNGRTTSSKVAQRWDIAFGDIDNMDLLSTPTIDDKNKTHV